MESFKKIMLAILEWLKSNWLLVLIVVAVIFVAWQFYQQKSQINDLAEMNAQEFQRHTADLAEMRGAYEIERTRQAEINERYETEIERLNTDYNQRLADLEARVTTRRQTFIRDTQGNPTEMADRLRGRLGWSTTP